MVDAIRYSSQAIDARKYFSAECTRYDIASCYEVDDYADVGLVPKRESVTKNLVYRWGFPTSTDRRGFRWTPKEEEYVMVLLNKGDSMSQVAKFVGRDASAIEFRVEKIAKEGFLKL